MKRIEIQFLQAAGTLMASLLSMSAIVSAAEFPAVGAFVDQQCIDCHDDVESKGGLDFTTLVYQPENPANLAEWVKIHDRAASGEMPPKKKKRPPEADLQGFLDSISTSITSSEKKQRATQGRATKRRLNRHEYEDTLRDILSLPDLQVANYLPEDSEAYGFNKVGEALDVSHVQMARYLRAADAALREALLSQVNKPEQTTTRYLTWDQPDFISQINQNPPLRRVYPLQGLEIQKDLTGKAAWSIFKLDSKTRESGAMGMLMSTYEPTYIRFGKFKAPVSGRYRLRLSAYSFRITNDLTTVSKGRRPEPVTLYAETPPELLRNLESFDIGTEPTVREVEVSLFKGETIRPDAVRLFRPRPTGHTNPNGDSEGMPGVAFQWLEVEGPLIEQWPPAGHRLLFGDLPTVAGKDGKGAEVISNNPGQDAERLLRGFMKQALRRPILEPDVARFHALVMKAMKDDFSFTDSMIAGYTAVLCSPEFLYLDARPGRLDDLALAERLSYFLWNSRPDDTLRQLAEIGKLHETAILQQQTERLINDPRSERFVANFLDYWLDLRQVNNSTPDGELYPEYQYDDYLVESLTDETRLFFTELLRGNLGVTNLIASDFLMINERLATLYKIPDVEGAAMRRVKLPPDSVRGGLLTQASVMKVTANGTTTSPVTRGVWIMGRLLGRQPSPPPPGIPAVEPDTRGVTTIRQQLEKHRSDPSCNSCHKNIDPPGFALESFDVMGAWRDRYRSLGEGDKVEGAGHDAIRFKFRLGPDVDPSGKLPDGREFENVSGLRKYLLADPEQLATNLVKQLAVYATGAPVGFSDRKQVDDILARCKPSKYGVRALVHALVQSDLFLNK